jgi:FkbM family methyltransferase
VKTDSLRSLLATHLPARLYGRKPPTRIAGWFYTRLYRYYAKGRLPVRVFLHGRSMFLNPGSPYPFLIADAPDFNSGLVASTACLHRMLGRPLRVVDLGAAIGDTVALLRERLPAAVESFICVDGAEENRPLFEANTQGIANLSAHFTLLAATPGKISSLVRQHAGTAMAAGRGEAPAITLDELLGGADSTLRVDLLKCDIDGCDGEALLGAREILKRCQPLVIFEWHPELIRRCGNDHYAAFQALGDAGYERFLWFSNRGPFSHRSALPTPAEVKWWAEFLIARHEPMGPHFDMVAVPRTLAPLFDEIPRAVVYPAAR